MKRIVKIEGVGSIGFPDSMSDREVSQAARRLYDDANPTNERSASPPRPSATSEDTSDWRHIATSDGQRFKIHPEDLLEAQRRDPGIKILDRPNQSPTDWVHVQFADNSVHQIHPADVNQALKQNPGAKVVGPENQ